MEINSGCLVRSLKCLCILTGDPNGRRPRWHVTSLAATNGAEMEYDRGSGTAGNHWEERSFLGELKVRFYVNRKCWKGFTPSILGSPDHVV
jgi:hypothetical protein